ncbi:restriction endonuclease subunit S [Frigoribacterium sp. R86507]|uniref:restriction endonuclease subunit S n=1 Tax=Frigoribacterium sp. R86507 TaxID=3093850 RepID=UPI0037CC325A
MKSIDTSDWGTFLIGELFEVVKGTRLTRAAMQEGTIRHIGASQFNNGITAMISNNENVHPGNLLTVCYDGPVGTTFYQAEPFWATDAVNVLYPRFDLTEARAMFLIPVIQKAGSRFDYGEKWGMGVMNSTPMMLPVSAGGTPDWALIDLMMQSLITEREAALETLLGAADTAGHATDMSDWVDFRLGDLFEVVNGSKYPLSWRIPGDIPLVSTSRLSNGISDMVGFPDGSGYVTHQDVLTIAFSGSVGATFYHSQPVFIGETVMGLIPKVGTKLASNSLGLWMSTAIEAAMMEFTYDRKVKISDVRERITIPLPVTPDGKPAWGYLEATMSNIIAEREQALDALVSLAGS